MITLVSHWPLDVIRRLSQPVSATRINKRIWIATALVGWGDRLLFCPIRIWGGHWGWINKQTEMPSFLCLTLYTVPLQYFNFVLLTFQKKRCLDLINEFSYFEHYKTRKTTSSVCASRAKLHQSCFIFKSFVFQMTKFGATAYLTSIWRRSVLFTVSPVYGNLDSVISFPIHQYTY